VMFYLSQILQCLRNDSEDQLLYRFLREASKASVLLSHQLLWIGQAELGEVKTGVKYVLTPFRQTIERLCADVIAHFDSVERQFYEHEFSFFEQITNISGILKPLPTKLERKEKIRQELEKIVKPSEHIYLPTNPQLKVVEIIPTSGAPMQSAAKVPILVAFKVKVGELDLSKERAAQQARHLRAASSATLAASRLLRGNSAPTDVLTDADEKEVDGFGDADNGAEANEEDGFVQPQVSIQITEEDAPMRGADEADAAAAAEASRLEAEQIELMVNPEVSESSEGVAHQLNTAMARERAAKLAAAKATADSEGVMVQACIFKVGDDCRQDALALQVIQWCKTIMQANGLDMFLYPYRVLPTRTGKDGIIGGVIECVPNAATRDEIGKATACSLKDYFISRFGPPTSAAFQMAQKRFIVSLAAYSVVCYILQVKDRHNGNVMISDDGSLVHIDFGFIFDISPAKNMKFESAGFKLTLEMVELMGSDGKTESPLVLWFEELVVRGFLAVREHRAEILAIVEPMLQSTLTCFMPHSLSGLRSRFFPNHDEQGAAEQMRAVVQDAWNKWTTNTYDWIQLKQQGVFYYAGTSVHDPQKRLRDVPDERDA